MVSTRQARPQTKYGFAKQSGLCQFWRGQLHGQVIADIRGEATGRLDGFRVGDKAGVIRLRSSAAEMVGMKYDAEGNLVPNPSAKWAISETTRDELR